MRWFSRVKSKVALDRITEERLYERASKEIDSEHRREGLWAKALSKSEGSEEKATALYIDFLVQKYKDESHLIVEALRDAPSPQAIIQQVSRQEPQSEDVHSNEDTIVFLSNSAGALVFWLLMGCFILSVVVGLYHASS